MRIHAVVIFFFLILCSRADSIESDAVFKRFQSHLLLKDYDSALTEVEGALSISKESPELLGMLIRVQAIRGQEKLMLEGWRRLQKIQPGLEGKEDLIEAMAWGILQNGARSSSVVTRATCMLAAFLSQKAEGVQLLRRGLEDSSSLVRLISVELAGRMRDEALKLGVLRLIRKEKMTQVRRAAIQAAGTMKLVEAQDDLRGSLERGQLSHEELAITVASLANMYEEVDREQLVSLSQSPRVALRLLSLEAILKFQLRDTVDILRVLAHDSHPDVRTSVYPVVGALELPREEALAFAEIGLNDSHPQIAISAARLLTLYEPERGMESLEKWVDHPMRQIRLYASAALASTGPCGVSLSQKILAAHPDPYVRVNSARHLCGQRVDVDKACRIVSSFLRKEKGRMTQKKNGVYAAIVPRALSDAGPDNLEAEDQMTRLELFQMLAIMGYPEVEGSIKKFLREKTFGITGMAAALLMTEGDEDAIEVVRGLLKDPARKVRVQAALVLAMWGRDEAAIEELVAAYQQSERSLKEKIIEGLGHIGSRSTLPFLTDKLAEPHMNLRVIAASSVLQLLEH